MVILVKFKIPKISVFTLVISCLTTANLPWSQTYHSRFLCSIVLRASGFTSVTSHTHTWVLFSLGSVSSFFLMLFWRTNSELVLFFLLSLWIWEMYGLCKLMHKLMHFHFVKVKWKVLVAQSSLILCDPMKCSLPGFALHGILQARILEWLTIYFSRWSSQPRDRTQVFNIADRFSTIWATREVYTSVLLFKNLRNK